MIYCLTLIHIAGSSQISRAFEQVYSGGCGATTELQREGAAFRALYRS